MTEWLPILNVVSLVVGVGAPVATLIYQAGKRSQWEKGMEKSHGECRDAREKNEDEIFGRLKYVEGEIKYQKGKLNGVRG